MFWSLRLLVCLLVLLLVLLVSVVNVERIVVKPWSPYKTLLVSTAENKGDSPGLLTSSVFDVRNEFGEKVPGVPPLFGVWVGQIEV